MEYWGIFSEFGHNHGFFGNNWATIENGSETQPLLPLFSVFSVKTLKPTNSRSFMTNSRKTTEGEVKTYPYLHQRFNTDNLYNY
jgi:hypothetical protein